MKYDQEDYENAIQALLLGMEQLDPDGNCCNICGDNDHQAWECHHNPLNWQKKAVWRCFHCNEVFTDEKSAGEHFGNPGPHWRKTFPLCTEDI